MRCDVHWSHTAQLSRDPPSHSTAQGPQTPLMGEDPRNHMADKRSKQLAAFLPHPQYTLLGLLQGPYKRIPAAPIHSCSSQGYRRWVYPSLPQSTGYILEYSSP